MGLGVLIKVSEYETVRNALNNIAQGCFEKYNYSDDIIIRQASMIITEYIELLLKNLEVELKTNLLEDAKRIIERSNLNYEKGV